jgi:hypothetical protein
VSRKGTPLNYKCSEVMVKAPRKPGPSPLISALETAKSGCRGINKSPFVLQDIPLGCHLVSLIGALLSLPFTTATLCLPPRGRQNQCAPSGFPLIHSWIHSPGVGLLPACRRATVLLPLCLLSWERCPGVSFLLLWLLRSTK